VAINDVLPLKATRRYAIANAKCFLGVPDTSDLISMVSFAFAMRRYLIRLASAPFTSFRLAKCGWVPCKTPGNEPERRTYGRCSKTAVLF